MKSVINAVLLAAAGPVIQEVVDVHFEVLQIVLRHVSNVILQLLQCYHLRVRHHAPIFVKAPQDASPQTDHRQKTIEEER